MADEEEMYEYESKQKRRRVYGGYRKPCNTRIEQLATPNRRAILALWMYHSYLFDEKRKESILRRLQELYSMTPEQAEKYFEEQKQQVKKALQQKKLQRRLLKAHRMQVEKQARKRAFRGFRKLLRKLINYSRTHAPPDLVTSRLRKMSDVILKQICEIRGLDVPRRTDEDPQSILLLSVSDWFAIFIDRLYYRVQLKKNQELEKIEEHERTLKTIDLENTAPLAASTPKQSTESIQNAVPLAASTPVHSDEGPLAEEVKIDEPEFEQSEEDINDIE